MVKMSVLKSFIWSAQKYEGFLYLISLYIDENMFICTNKTVRPLFQNYYALVSHFLIAKPKRQAEAMGFLCQLCSSIQKYITTFFRISECYFIKYNCLSAFHGHNLFKQSNYSLKNYMYILLEISMDCFLQGWFWSGKSFQLENQLFI